MKYICVPLSKEAKARLDYNENIDGDLVEINISESDFFQLWDTGLFDSLNEKLDLMFDIGEDEEIKELNKMEKAKEIVGNYYKKYKDIILLGEIMDLIDVAIRNKTGIFFYF
ncbi:hypothetical protein FACS189476_02810 [Spirochaetia bacterium]|nr:hypothetical protein FACS189476_02810 [Spirochaetia bacterium]